jgi:hypothetical protein
MRRSTSVGFRWRDWPQCLCCRVGILLAQIGQHQMLACTDPPGDSLADRSGSNNYDDLCHDISFVLPVGVFVSRH